MNTLGPALHMHMAPQAHTHTYVPRPGTHHTADAEAGGATLDTLTTCMEPGALLCAGPRGA
jgi:hypothetical protein